MIMQPDGAASDCAGDRIRVLHILSGDLWAGAEVASYHLLVALSARTDVDVSAVVLNSGPLAEALLRAGVDTEVWSESELSFLSLARRLRPYAAGFSIVHAHRHKENLLALCSGRPWVTTQHGMPEPFAGWAAVRSRLKGGLDFAAKRFSASRVIAVSHAMERELRGRFPRKVRCVRNGIGDPLAELSPLPWAERPKRCGILARLVPVKGIELAIDSVACAEGFELEIVGDGPCRELLERRAVERGVAERVEFTGFDPKPLRRLAAWRWLLVTSYHEGLPVSVLEAMALGTPVATTDLPGVREVIGGDAGIVLEDRSPQTWGHRLSERIDDEGAGACFSLAARARFEAEFLADETASRMLRVYCEAARR